MLVIAGQRTFHRNDSAPAAAGSLKLVLAPKLRTATVLRTSTSTSSRRSLMGAEHPLHPLTPPAESLKIWHLGLADVRQEYILPTELPIEGTIPRELNLTLLRNGPGRWGRAKHWFDAQGNVNAFDVVDGRIFYRNRLVHPEAFQIEATRKQALYGEYGSPLPHGLWTVARQRAYKNAANTSCVYHADRLFATSEGAPPVELDRVTLKTRGTCRFNNVLGPTDTFSAHPKVHPVTGDVWNFGVSYNVSGARGLVGTLKLYQWDTSGEMTVSCTSEMPFPGPIHDFCLTANKAVFFLPPVSWDAWPWDWYFGKKELGRMMQWRSDEQTHVLIVDLPSGTAKWTKTDPMLVQHVGNGYGDGDGVTLDLCDAEDPKALDMWFDILQGDLEHRRLPKMRRVHITAAGTVEPRDFPDVEMDFPMVDPRYIGQNHSKVFGVRWDAKSPFFGVPCKLDVPSGTLEVADLAYGEYAGECLLVNKATPGHAEGDAWVLTIVLNTVTGQSSLRIYDGANWQLVGSALVPQVVPYGFHGIIIPGDAARQSPLDRGSFP